MSNDSRLLQFLKEWAQSAVLELHDNEPTVSVNGTAFASIIGQFHSITPSVNQNAKPTANVMCIQSETPFVSRV
jgi:hypothetical protein